MADEHWLDGLSKALARGVSRKGFLRLSGSLALAAFAPRGPVAAAYLRSPDGGGVQRMFTAGFCFGGSNSWRQSAAQPGLAGAIGFYGQPARVRDTIGQMRAPLLLLVAGADFTPLEEFQRFDQELTQAGVAHRMVVYDGAPHSFFDRTFVEHREASEDAWRQILAFVREQPEP